MKFDCTVVGCCSLNTRRANPAAQLRLCNRAKPNVLMGPLQGREPVSGDSVFNLLLCPALSSPSHFSLPAETNMHVETQQGESNGREWEWRGKSSGVTKWLGLPLLNFTSCSPCCFLAGGWRPMSPDPRLPHVLSFKLLPLSVWPSERSLGHTSH